MIIFSIIIIINDIDIIDADLFYNIYKINYVLGSLLVI